MSFVRTLKEAHDEKEESNFEDYRHSLKYLVSLLDLVTHLCPAHTEAYVSKDILVRAFEGFEQIAAGQVIAEVQGERQVYHFEGFSVALKVEL